MKDIEAKPYTGQLTVGQHVVGFTDSGQGYYHRDSYKKCWNGHVTHVGEKDGKPVATIKRTKFKPVNAIKVGGKWIWKRSSSKSWWNDTDPSARIVVPTSIGSWKNLIEKIGEK